jgi:ABC-type transporter Mla MlaB component
MRKSQGRLILQMHHTTHVFLCLSVESQDYLTSEANQVTLTQAAQFWQEENKENLVGVSPAETTSLSVVDSHLFALLCDFLTLLFRWDCKIGRVLWQVSCSCLCELVTLSYGTPRVKETRNMQHNCVERGRRQTK